MSRFRPFWRGAVAAACLAIPTTTVFAQECPPAPCVPYQPSAPVAQPSTPAAPTTPAPSTPSFANTPDLFAGADAGPSVGLGGYIDNARPTTQFRMRYDANYNANRPDRAEFFYPKCGCFATLQPPQLDAKGPPLAPERRVDFQELGTYLEYAATPRFSLFTNIPVRFINPDLNKNAAGISDLSFGVKYAAIYDQHQILTFQTRVIVPTGNTESGLGTGVTWIEPGVLYQRQLTERWQGFGQLKEQIYLKRQSDFTANVLNYGLGTSYVVWQGCNAYVAPVTEVVGWTVLGGKELDPDVGAVSSYGATIVNAKFGLRMGLGQANAASGTDLYIGYGRALTGEVWYKDILRAELRHRF